MPHKVKISTQPRKEEPASKRIKDNLYQYGAGTVFGAIMAGIFVNEIVATVVLLGAVLVGSVAIMVESIEEWKKALKPEDVQDIQMLMLNLSEEVKQLTATLPEQSSAEIEEKLEQLERQVQDKLGQSD